MRIARYGTGLLIAGLVLWLATMATRDCSVGPYLAANCLSLWVSHKLGLAFSPLLRSLVLEIAGLILVGGLYLTFRFVVPRSSKKASHVGGTSEAAGSSSRS